MNQSTATFVDNKGALFLSVPHTTLHDSFAADEDVSDAPVYGRDGLHSECSPDGCMRNLLSGFAFVTPLSGKIQGYGLGGTMERDGTDRVQLSPLIRLCRAYHWLAIARQFL